MLLEGMFLPLTTPFYPDGRLNTAKLEDNVRRYSKTPAAGLAVLSHTGQPTLLSDTETQNTLQTVALTSAAEKVLVAGIARDSATGTLDLIEYAAETGYDAVLIPVPSLLRGLRRAGSPKEMLTFFSMVADRSSLPIVLDCGSQDDITMSEDLVADLAQHGNVFGMVDASGDAGRVTNLLRRTLHMKRDVPVTTVFAAVTGRMIRKNLPPESTFLSAGALSGGGTALSTISVAAATAMKTRMKTVGFQILCGRTRTMLEALNAGAIGAMPPLAASAPLACYEVLAAWKDGDPTLAAEKQERLLLLSRRIEEAMEVAGIKYGCDLNGYFGGRPRLPSLPLTGAERAEIETLMQGVRN